MSSSELDRKLRRAARKGKVEEIAKLLDAGADIEAQGGFFTLGQPALICAIYAGQKNAVKYLLDRGANIEAQDLSGDTPLWTAVAHNHKEIVELLLDRGADPRRRCGISDRYSPLQMATQNKNTDVAVLLSEAILASEKRDAALREKLARERDEREKREKEAERSKDRDVVIVFSPLGDRTLQEVYNFAALERVSLIRKGEDGPVEAVTRQDFADIGDKPGLRRAFAEHVSRGGTASEKSVFAGSLQKLKPLHKDTP